MNIATVDRTDESQIRELLDDWVQAARANDIDGIMGVYALDIVAFDAIARLQFKGADAYRKHWEMCLAMCPGPTIFEIHESKTLRNASGSTCSIHEDVSPPGSKTASLAP